jgi:hypothetical protein
VPLSQIPYPGGHVGLEVGGGDVIAAEGLDVGVDVGGGSQTVGL